MFDRLKNLFSKRRSELSGGSVSTATGNARAVSGAGLRPPALPKPQEADSTPPPEIELDGGGAAPVTQGTEHFVRLALRPIILALPAALKARVRQPPSGNAQITVSVDRVLPQLGTGSAKISFGELRQAAPAGIFADLSDQDQAPVELPLNDILSQLPPELLPRRGGQKRIEVPDEVTPIFGPKGEQLTNIRMIKETGRGQSAAAPAAPAPNTIAAPAPPPIASSPRSTVPPPPALRPPAAAPPSPARPAGPIPGPALPPPPAAPIKPSAPLPSPASLRPAPAAPAPVPSPAPAAQSRTAHPLYGSKPAGIPQQPAPLPGTAPAPTRPVVPQEPLVIPLSSLASSLPEPVRQALAQSLANDAVLAVPGESVEQGLKRGKVAFAWSELRSMISPPLASTTAAEINDTVVDLPLPVIAPLFLARKKPAAAQKKYDVGEDIPDVFQGRGLSPAVTAAAAAAAAPPVEEPAPAPAPAAPASMPKDIGEVFGQPGRKNWTPIEIVQRTSSLTGVAGALIAMQDGLLVAGQLPPGLNGETIAAFIPQMYTRMMQYCKELKFNDSTNLTVLVDSVPLKIFRAGNVYFTVLGRDRDSLPEPHLTIVASHLEPQSK